MKKISVMIAAFAMLIALRASAYEAYVIGTDLHFTNVESVTMTTVDCAEYKHTFSQDISQFYIHWDIRLSDGTKWEVENGAVATNAPIEHDDGSIRKLIKDSKKKK